MITSMIKRLRTVLQQWQAQRRQQAELALLTPRDLVDLGICRSEYESCLCEADGRVAATRLRLWQAGLGGHRVALAAR